jgi:hypothetical protein
MYEIVCFTTTLVMKLLSLVAVNQFLSVEVGTSWPSGYVMHFCSIKVNLYCYYAKIQI